MPIIAPISRDERCLMDKAIHKTHDKSMFCALIILTMPLSGKHPEKYVAEGLFYS